MRFTLTTAATMASLLSSTTHAAPAPNPLADTAAPMPSSPKALAAWASARGLGYDPSKAFTPTAGELLSPPSLRVASLLQSAAIPSFLPSSPGSLPSVPQLSARDVVGPKDDRYQFTAPDTYPFRAVGQVAWANGVFCTGQLIGPRHVLTAKHCVPAASGQNVTFRFAPSYDRGPNAKYGWATVTNTVFTAGTFSSGDEACDVQHDGAVAVIDRRFGDELGYFAAQMPDNSSWNQPIFTNMGYPGDKDGGSRPYRQDGNALIKPSRPEQFSCDKKSGPIWSDSDSSGGQSGGAIWRDGNIIWGTLGVFVNNQAGWASGDKLLNVISTARNTYR